MLSRKLIRADLNLLIALQALLEERNVTRAAERLYITQPALSKTLQKLRDLFDDPLFSRTAYGLIPTPKALELEEQLPNILRQINHLIGGSDFVPAEYAGEFRLAMPSSTSAWIMPKLLSRLAAEAPNVKLHVEDPSAHFIDELTSGQLDYALHLAKEYPGAIYTEDLGAIAFNCIMRADHPLAKKRKLSQKDLLEFPHVRLYVAKVTKSDIGVVDEMLERQGLNRHIILETPHLSACLDTVAQTDALLIAAANIVEQYGERLTAKPLPEEFTPSDLRFGLIYHRRVTGHSPHLWLKDVIVDTLKTLA